MKVPEQRPYPRPVTVPAPNLSLNERAMCRAFSAAPKLVEVADEPLTGRRHSLVARFLRQRGFVVTERIVETIMSERRLRVYASWPHETKGIG